MKHLKMYQCPYCGSTKVTRARRKKWMKLIPLSEYRSCRSCQGRYLVIFGAIRIPLSNDYSSVVKLTKLSS